MEVAGHWSHEEWQHDDERRFRVTLGLSLAIHAVLLLAWKLPPPAWKPVDSAVLTVVLRGATTAVPVSVPVPEPPRDVPVLVQKDSDLARFSVPPKPQTPAPAAPVPPRLQPKAGGEPGRIVGKPSPGRVTAVAPAAVGYSVMLVTDGEGRVGQIYWDKLPALSDEQLRKVERALRARKYLPSQTVTEVFDVRDFLKLAPARSEDDLPPPADQSAAAM